MNGYYCEQCNTKQTIVGDEQNYIPAKPYYVCESCVHANFIELQTESEREKLRLICDDTLDGATYGRFWPRYFVLDALGYITNGDSLDDIPFLFDQVCREVEESWESTDAHGVLQKIANAKEAAMYTAWKKHISPGTLSWFKMHTPNHVTIHVDRLLKVIPRHELFAAYDDFMCEQFTKQRTYVREPFEHNRIVQKLWSYAVTNKRHGTNALERRTTEKKLLEQQQPEGPKRQQSYRGKFYLKKLKLFYHVDVEHYDDFVQHYLANDDFVKTTLGKLRNGTSGDAGDTKTHHVDRTLQHRLEKSINTGRHKMRLRYSGAKNWKIYAHARRKTINLMDEARLRSEIDVDGKYFAIGEFLYAAPSYYTVFPPIVFVMQVMLMVGILWNKSAHFSWGVLEDYGNNHCVQYMSLSNLAVDPQNTKCVDTKGIWEVELRQSHCVLNTSQVFLTPRLYRFKSQKRDTEAYVMPRTYIDYTTGETAPSFPVEPLVTREAWDDFKPSKITPRNKAYYEKYIQYGVLNTWTSIGIGFWGETKYDFIGSQYHYDTDVSPVHPMYNVFQESQTFALFNVKQQDALLCIPNKQRELLTPVWASPGPVREAVTFFGTNTVEFGLNVSEQGFRSPIPIHLRCHNPATNISFTYEYNYSKPFIGYVCNASQLHHLAWCPAGANPQLVDTIEGYDNIPRRMLMSAIGLLYFIRYFQNDAQYPEQPQSARKRVCCGNAREPMHKREKTNTVICVWSFTALVVLLAGIIFLSLVRIGHHAVHEIVYTVVALAFVFLSTMVTNACCCWRGEMHRPYTRLGCICDVRKGICCRSHTVMGKLMNHAAEPLCNIFTHPITGLSMVLDNTMNVLCYLANIWIIYIETDPLDMLLNSIAMEFIVQLDNEILPVFFNSAFKTNHYRRLLKFREQVDLPNALEREERHCKRMCPKYLTDFYSLHDEEKEDLVRDDESEESVEDDTGLDPNVSLLNKKLETRASSSFLSFIAADDDDDPFDLHEDELGDFGYNWHFAFRLWYFPVPLWSRLHKASLKSAWRKVIFMVFSVTLLPAYYVAVILFVVFPALLFSIVAFICALWLPLCSFFLPVFYLSAAVWMPACKL